MGRKLKVKCLVLDHDDTVVKSTPEINYPSFKNALAQLRPEGSELIPHAYEGEQRLLSGKCKGAGRIIICLGKREIIIDFPFYIIGFGAGEEKNVGLDLKI